MHKVYNYLANVEAVLNVIKGYDSPVVLDSQTEDRSLSRYTIISFDPIQTIKYDSQLEVNGQIVNQEPLKYIDDILQKNNQKSELVFCGGFIGVIRYQYLEDIFKFKLDNQHQLPKIEGGIYEHGIVIDYLKNTTTIFNRNGDLKKLTKIIEVVTLQEKVKANSSYNLFQSKQEYVEAIENTKSYIKSGDVYEINYTTGYYGKTSLSASQLFTNLRTNNPVPFAAYLQFTDNKIVSASPELFFKRVGNQIYTQPMKGTIARGKNKEEDQENLRILKASEKDKTELTMIIDLMRNDISKICTCDSVEVKNPFSIKSYSTVYQQVADVVGNVKPGVGIEQIFKSLFPSGSITGAPKLRSIEVIDELENRSRETYTGCIGFYSYNHSACFNVAIRTLDMQKDKYIFNVGGAIVWDSTSDGEYDECAIKAKALLNGLGVDND